MSKMLFASLLREHFSLDKTELESCWQMALNARLPRIMFEVLTPYLIRLPQIHEAYKQKQGEYPIMINEDMARRYLLEAFVEGPRYMRELASIFSIPSELRQKVIQDLINEKLLSWEYCPIGNCIAYKLNPYNKVPGHLLRRLNDCLRNTRQISLNAFSYRVGVKDYHILCLMCAQIAARTESVVTVTTVNGQITLSRSDLYEA